LLHVSRTLAAHRNLPSFPTRRSSDLDDPRKEDREDHDRDDEGLEPSLPIPEGRLQGQDGCHRRRQEGQEDGLEERVHQAPRVDQDRKSTRLNSSHEWISYAVFCLKKK